MTLGQGPEMKTTRKCCQHNKPIGIKIIDLQSRNKLKIRRMLQSLIDKDNIPYIFWKQKKHHKDQSY